MVTRLIQAAVTCSRDRQQRLLARLQLHIDRSEQSRRARVVAHQQDQVDKRVRSKQSFGRGEGLRGHPVVAPELAAKFDDNRVCIVKPQGVRSAKRNPTLVRQTPKLRSNNNQAHLKDKSSTRPSLSAMFQASSMDLGWDPALVALNDESCLRDLDERLND